VSTARTVDAPILRAADLGPRVWSAIVVLALAGELAWAIENFYLNVFVYDTITDDPDVIATMVAASAITSTLATIVFGALSDRLGRRRAFVAVGYLLWGGSTAAFGLLTVETVRVIAPLADATLVASTAIIVLDCVMSMLGSGAYDAAFQAWVTDVTRPQIRGRVESVLAVAPLVSTLAVFGGLDGLARAGRWQLFFGLVGVTVSVMGVVSCFLVRDVARPSLTEQRFLASVLYGLRPRAIRANPGLYLALAAWSLWGISTQVFLPYLLIYMQNYLRIQAYALVLGVFLLGAAAVTVVGGRIIDRVGKTRFLLPAVLVYVAGLALMWLARGTGPVVVAGFVMMSGFMLVLAPVGALVRDYTPPGRAGHVQGLRMIFTVLIPMVVGPYVGATVIKNSATYVDMGVVKQVPTPTMFLAALAVAALILPPVAALRHRPPALPVAPA
jgi:MFS family permease